MITNGTSHRLAPAFRTNSSLATGNSIAWHCFSFELPVELTLS
jgi:hypothetical protein